MQDDAVFETVRGPGVFGVEKKITTEDGLVNLEGKITPDNKPFLYTLVVSNSKTEPSEIRDVVLTDAIPEGLTYVAGTLTLDGVPVPNGDTYVKGQNLSFPLGTLLEGESKTITFSVNVTDVTKVKSENIGTATGNVTSDPSNPGDEELKKDSNPVVSKRAPNPEIKKTINKDKALKGDELTYKLVVTNGTKDFTGNLINGVVTDSLPSEVSYKPNTTKIDGGLIPDSTSMWNGQNFTYQLPTPLQGGVTIVIEFTVIVETNDIKTNILNSAELKGEDGTSYTKDSAVPFETVRGPADFSVKKKVTTTDGVTDLEGKVTPDNSPFMYTLVVSNSKTDPSEIRDIVLTDTIPEGLIYLSGSLTLDGTKVANGDSHITGQDLSLPLGTLLEGEQKTVTFIVEITDHAKVNSKNTGKITGNITKDPNNPVVEEIKDSSNTVSSKRAPNPTITKSINQPKANKGEELTYQLVVTNGTADYTGDLIDGVVKDTLPDEVAYKANSMKVDGVPISDAGMWQGQELTYSLPTPFQGGATTTIEFTVTVVTNEIKTGIINTASVTGLDEDNTPYIPPTSSAEFETVRVPGILGKEKKVFDLSNNDIHGQVIQVNDVIRYGILVRNDEVMPSKLSAIRILDTLPTGVIYQPGTLKADGVLLPDTHFTGQTLDLSLAKVLLEGEEALITFDVAITDKADPTVNNIATIEAFTIETATIPESSGTNDVDVSLAPIPTIVKSVDKAAANPDDELTYTLIISNGEKGGLLKGAKVTDILPSNVSYVKESTTLNHVTVPDAISWSTAGTLSVDIPDLKAGESATVSFKVSVLVPAIGTTILNTALLDNLGTIPAITSNEVATPVYPLPGELVATKGVNDAAGNSLADKVVAIGEQVTYSIVVENSSEIHRVVDDVVINDTIPDEVTYVKGTLTLDGATLPDSHIVDNQLTVPVGTLAGGEKATVCFDVTVTKMNVTTLAIKNVATITGSTADGLGGKIATTPLKPEVSTKLELPSAEVVKTVDTSKAKAGESISYQLVVTNTAELTNWNGSIKDTLPVDTEYVANSTKVNGTAVSDASVWNSNQLSVDIKELAPKATANVQFSVKVKAGVMTGTIVNTASILSTITGETQLSNTVTTILYADPKDPNSVLPNTILPQNSVTPSNVSPKSQDPDPEGSSSTLPKTGEHNQNLVLFGMALLVGNISWYALYRRKEAA